MKGLTILIEFSLCGWNRKRQVSVQLHLFAGRTDGGTIPDLRPPLSSHDPPLIGHLPQRFPILLGYGFNHCLQPVAHLRTDGEFDPRSPRNLFTTPVQQFMNIGGTIGAKPYETNRFRQCQNSLLKHRKQRQPCRDIAISKLSDHFQILLGPICDHGMISLLPKISHVSFPLMTLNQRGVQINRRLPGSFLTHRLPYQPPIQCRPPLKQNRFLRNEPLIGYPFLQGLLFMKSIQEPTCCLSRRNTQPQGSQTFVLSQKLKIIHAIPSRTKNRNKRLHIIGLLILARALKKGKMLLNRGAKAQGPEGFYDKRAPCKRGHHDLGVVFNEGERK